MWVRCVRSNLAGVASAPRGEATSESANDLSSRRTLIDRLTGKISSVPVRYSTFARRLGRTHRRAGDPWDSPTPLSRDIVQHLTVRRKGQHIAGNLCLVRRGVNDPVNH
jgi:hypothetical protein